MTRERIDGAARLSRTASRRDCGALRAVIATMLLGGGLLVPDAAAWAATAGAPHLDGGELGLIWIVPFVGILLSIAILPLLAPTLWHNHFGKISGAWALAFIGPFTIIYGFELALYEVLHTLFQVKPTAELSQCEGMKNILESLLPYTERHFERVDGLIQGSFMVRSFLPVMCVPIC